VKILLVDGPLKGVVKEVPEIRAYWWFKVSSGTINNWCYYRITNDSKHRYKKTSTHSKEENTDYTDIASLGKVQQTKKRAAPRRKEKEKIEATYVSIRENAIEPESCCSVQTFLHWQETKYGTRNSF
jgi:hypothetical protein